MPNVMSSTVTELTEGIVLTEGLQQCPAHITLSKFESET